MKCNIGKYEQVNRLPGKAITVKQYADKMQFTTPYVYKLIREGKNKFKIVQFRGVNFIVEGGGGEFVATFENKFGLYYECITFVIQM